MKFLSAIALAFALVLGCAAPSLAEDKPVRIGYYSYSDVIFTTQVVKYILEKR